MADGLGELLRNHRRRALLSQEALAERAGVSVRAIRDIERARVTLPRRESLMLIADALGLDDVARRGVERAARRVQERQLDAEVPPGQVGTGRRARAEADRRAVAPAQLPLDLRTFAGRRRELAVLDRLLDSDGGRSAGATVGTVSGRAGVGKSALAVHWAHGAADRFPDGILHLDLRGSDPAGGLPPAVALRTLLDAFEPERVPAGFEAQVGLYRTILADRRVLIVLDDAAGSAQVRPLLASSAGCLTLVTSRDDLTGLVVAQGAVPLRLGLPTPAEAREMLARRVPADPTWEESGLCAEVVARCGRLPLTLALIAARVVLQPDRALRELARRDREAAARARAFRTSSRPA